VRYNCWTVKIWQFLQFFRYLQFTCSASFDILYNKTLLIDADFVLLNVSWRVRMSKLYYDQVTCRRCVIYVGQTLWPRLMCLLKFPLDVKECEHNEWVQKYGFSPTWFLKWYSKSDFILILLSQKCTRSVPYLSWDAFSSNDCEDNP